MEQRISIKDLEPGAYKAMSRLESYLSSTELDKGLSELIKVKASQINGCAYCIDMHTELALKHGESPRRLFALNAWRESPLFDEKEKTAFKITEEVTLIANQGLTSETYHAALKHFTENEIAQIIMCVGIINIWNRIAVSTHLVYEG